ncbi:MAG: 5'-nucleotidase C-terminal domain-containing protein, partial [Streptococcaceae bacterium]|nr:5'-nucleotidase C-terminal domain-containing protein [Streptococcaceae bacterium]
ETTKVGFIGIATTNTPNLVLRRHVEGFDFLDEAQTIAKYSAELRAQGVNAIVVMGHVGSSSLAGIAAGDAVEIMNRVNELDANNSVDVFVAAHNHLFTNGLAGNTRIVQSTSNGRGYIDLQGTIDTQTGDFVSAPTAEVRPVAPNVGILPDNNVQAIVNEATYITNEVAARKIGRTADGQPISRTVNKARGESPVGNLITDAQRYMANVEGLNVDFAMTNNGGIRDDLRVNSLGEVTWGAAQAVQPFGNILQVIEMTGDQVERVLNQQFIGTSNLFLQISGLRYTYVETPNGPQTHEILNVTKEDGTPIVADETYRVIVNEFIYAGGDGFSVFTEAKFVEGMATDTNTFINFIELMTSRGQALSASTGDRKILVTPEVEALKNNAANILANGLSQSQLTFNNGVVTLTLDGYSFVLSENANNRNIAGTISINDQFELRFDIKGNGSNVKVFEVVEK